MDADVETCDGCEWASMHPLQPASKMICLLSGAVRRRNSKRCKAFKPIEVDAEGRPLLAREPERQELEGV